ncbi:methylamine--glutamate N-methyltransferase [Malassezia yamatoensis]|uniref:tRNA (guanine(26)-N(2))-dimethyltransferase n=1 Tax=Malassezia yamatoensis TaxID=253288 RepID=A0AAJ5YNH0_9BASI|nr:methylamine--glutamate N-methyltransferase [Malassezia yamatoensis]
MAPEPILLSAEAAAKRGIHIKSHEAAFRENSATIVMPSKEAAFLNPVQEFNRDLSTLAITAWSQIYDREKKRVYEAHMKSRNLKRTKRGEPEIKRAKIDEDYRHHKFTILEALSATGLRSIRYAKEIPLLGSIIANDLSATAVQAMRRNLALNFPPGRPLEEVTEILPGDTLNQGEPDKETNDDTTKIQETSDEHISAPDARSIDPDCKVKANQGDAIALMYAHRDPSKRFDVVDLDPYGTAAPFLDAAVQSVGDGGLLCVTCTDLAVLAGHNYPEKCWSLYGGVSVKAEYSHEVALRLVLHAIATTAGKYGRYIQPMLSLSIDFYLRVFVRVWTRPETVKLNASKTGLVYTCSKCSDFHIQPMGRAVTSANVKTNLPITKFGSASGPPTDTRCGECGGSFHVGGPMWFGAIQDPDFCDEMLRTLDSGSQTFGTEARVRGMVSTARDVSHFINIQELEAPFYFHPAKIAGLFHCTSPPLAPVM